MYAHMPSLDMSVLVRSYPATLKGPTHTNDLSTLQEQRSKEIDIIKEAMQRISNNHEQERLLRHEQQKARERAEEWYIEQERRDARTRRQSAANLQAEEDAHQTLERFCQSPTAKPYTLTPTPQSLQP